MKTTSYYIRKKLKDKILINAESISGEFAVESETENTKRIAGTYLHGHLQKVNGFDMFGIIGELPIYDGIYPCDVIGINDNCTLYLWTCSNGRPHGLLVANSDYESLMHAQDKYYEKSTII